MIYIKYSPLYLLVSAVYVQVNVVNYVGFDVEVGYLMWIFLGYVRFYVGGHVAQNVQKKAAASLHVFSSAIGKSKSGRRSPRVQFIVSLLTAILVSQIRSLSLLSSSLFSCFSRRLHGQHAPAWFLVDHLPLPLLTFWSF